MKERALGLLENIVREHIRSAQPVGSAFLAENFGLNLSSATVRNEMAELEREGYICQPHTSAGRIPTEKGYCFYIENFLRERGLARGKKLLFDQAKKRFRGSREALIKETAKLTAEMSKGTVIVGFDRNSVYYTGIANLFSQPEFREYDSIYDISKVIDRLDELTAKAFGRVGDDVEILIGKENPFSEFCGTVVTRYGDPARQAGIFGVLGPMRMDYDRNVSLVKYAKEVISG